VNGKLFHMCVGVDSYWCLELSLHLSSDQLCSIYAVVICIDQCYFNMLCYVVVVIVLI